MCQGMINYMYKDVYTIKALEAAGAHQTRVEGFGRERERERERERGGEGKTKKRIEELN